MNDFREITPAPMPHPEEWGNLREELVRAVARREFTLLFQPQVSTVTRRIAGAEALIRWTHPAFGLINPARFIPVCEQAGLMDAVGDWVIDTAFQSQRKLTQGGYEVLMSLNLSPYQLKDPSLVERIARQAEVHGVNPRWIELELTESAFIDEKAMPALHALRDKGFSLAIDDFGTGYSCLAYLQRLPVNTLKIDRAFINMVDEGNDAVPSLIADLASALSLDAVAEGVESLHQLRWLSEHDVGSYQGYLFSPPVTLDILQQLLDRQETPQPGVHDVARPQSSHEPFRQAERTRRPAQKPST